MKSSSKLFWLLIASLSLTTLACFGANLPPKRSTHYDGSVSAKINYGASLAYDSSLAMTVEAWVYRENGARTETVLGRNSGSSYWFGFAGGQLRFHRSGGAYKDADRQVPANQWTHVAASYDGAQVSFYIDGQAAGTFPLANSGANRSEVLYLGGDLLNRNFIGNLDEVRLWMRARSGPEIQADMYREVTSGTGLAFVAPEGGTDGTGTRREVFGILPRGLVVPRVHRAVTLDGCLNVPGEYPGAEQMVIRYHDGANARDAVAYLVYFDEPTDPNKALYVGVKGERDTLGGWDRHNSFIGVNVDPNYSRDPLAQPTDFRVRGWLDASSPTWGWGDGIGGFTVSAGAPSASLWSVAYAYCENEFAPPSMEFRIDKSLLGQWTETDGIALGHFDVDSALHDFIAPADALGNSPATWTPMTYGDYSVATSPVTLQGSVLDEETHRSLPGHRVILKSGADRAHAIAVAETVTTAGGFSFVNVDVDQAQPTWVELEVQPYTTYLSAQVSGAAVPAIIVDNRTVQYAHCPSPGVPCNLGRVDFHVQAPITTADVRVLAVEVSQAIQNHLNYPEDGPDGTAGADVPLVPGKDMLVRFYVVGRDRAISHFSGSLSATIQPPRGTTVLTTSFDANNGAINLEADEAPAARARDALHSAQLLRLRTNPNATLNFIIPADRVSGVMTFSLRVNGAEAAPPMQYRMGSPTDLTLNFIRVIHPSLGTPLSVDEILQFAPTVKSVYPASHVRTIVSRDYNWGGGDTDDMLDDVWRGFGGDRAPSVGPLRPYEYAPVIGVARNLPDPRTAGLAWVNGSPGGSRPLRSGGAAICVLDPMALAHEIGHTFGLIHASNFHGESGGGDWEDWSVFFNPHAFMSGEPGLVGTFGAQFLGTGSGARSWSLLDPRPGAALPRVDPTGLADSVIPHDLMSYGRTIGTPEWVSKTTYGRLAQVFYYGRPLPVVHAASLIPAGAPTVGSTTEAMLVGGVLKPKQPLQLRPIIQKRLPTDMIGDFAAGPYSLELRDAAGQLLVQTTFDMNRPADGKNDGRLSFDLPLLKVAGVKRVVVKKGGLVLLDQAASPHTPKVKVLSPNGGEQITQGRVPVSWSATDADGDPLSILVQYSPDGGQTWQGLNWIKPGGPTNTEIVVGQVIPGNQALVRVTASDGLNFSVDESDATFSVGATYQWDAPPKLQVDHQRSNVVLSWEGRKDSAMVQSASTVTGPWTDKQRGLTTDGRNYAMVIPCDQPAQFFRLKMLPESCFDLGGFPLGDVPNPWEVGGLKFVSRLAVGSEAATGKIVWENSHVGYDITYQLEVEFSETCDLLDIDLQQQSGLVDIVAYDEEGATVDSNQLLGADGAVRHATLRALGTPIKRIIITSPNGRAQLLSLCRQTLPVDAPTDSQN